MTKTLLYFLLFFAGLQANSQTCPPNIGFDFGNFTNWQCYIGNINYDACGPNDLLVITDAATAPVATRHTIIPPTTMVDPFGGFPMNPGSKYVAKLGAAGQYQYSEQMERISYTFTVPANAVDYSLTYKYATVHQYVPTCGAHFGARVYDVTAGEYITCYERRIYSTVAGNGFQQSSQTSLGSPVYYKPWSDVTMMLAAYAGHTLRLDFINADCAPSGHWCYSYVDVMENCGMAVTGNEYCPNSSANVTAPSGYQVYNWWNSNFTQQVGNSQVLHLSSPPAVPTVYAVDLIPFPGTSGGCRDTLYVTVKPSSTNLLADAGPDHNICKGTSVTLGTPALTGLSYLWNPADPMLPPGAAQMTVQPAQTTSYMVTVTDAAGCVATDQVTVNVTNIATPTITATGSVLTSSSPTGNQWYLNGTAIAGATGSTYTATVAGTYTVMVTINNCTSNVSNSIAYTITGVSAIIAEWKLQIMPNPVTEKLVISHNGNQKLDLEIFDLTGRRVYSGKNISPGFTVDMTSFSEGAYMVKLVNQRNKKEVKQQIVKLK